MKFNLKIYNHGKLLSDDSAGDAEEDDWFDNKYILLCIAQLII